MKKVYLRFLSLASALDEASTQLAAIDETAKRLLEMIVLRHEQGHSMTVTDAMTIASLASPATIHRKLDDLREAGLIDHVFQGHNRRTKYLVPTQAADAYFVNLGKVMSEVMRTI